MNTPHRTQRPDAPDSGPHDDLAIAQELDQDCRCHPLAGAMILDSGHCTGCGRRVVGGPSVQVRRP